MPKTKFQEFVYGLMMTFFMVLAMEFYNAGLREGALTAAGMLDALKEMRIMFPVCFVMGFFLIDLLAPKLAFRMVTPGEDRPVFITLVRASITVAFMCPIMSFWATLFLKQPAAAEFIPSWLQTVVCNFPMAFFWQVFYCGPLVRFLFRLIFADRGERRERRRAEKDGNATVLGNAGALQRQGARKQMARTGETGLPVYRSENRTDAG